MAEYNINFSTNASQIAKELSKVQTELAKAVQMTKPGGLEIKLSLNTSQLEASINTTFRKLNKEIESNQRKLSRLQIGGGNFDLIAGRLGRAEGQKERGQLLAAPSRLRGQAEAFEFGSEIRSKKILESLRIQASQIAPNTVEWTTFQQLIGQVTLELKQADKAAESIQLTQQLGALAPGSLSRLDKQLTILKNRARDITPNTVEWKKLNKEIQKVETSIQKVSKKPMTMGQRAGAAGGAFLYGGGMGGGVGSAFGGIAGGLMGGVPGAFTGAAIGQAVDSLGGALAGITSQAAAVQQLQRGLALASIDAKDFAEAQSAVADVSSRLFIPLEQVTKSFAQLRVNTKQYGLSVEETKQILEGTILAVSAFGGSADDVDGAMRAVVQILSKGSVQAEELRGQLGERFPGAVIKFAQANKLSFDELQDRLKEGTIGIKEFVTFAKDNYEDYAEFSKTISTAPEFAGRRLAKALEEMQMVIGQVFGSSGATIQDFSSQALKDITQFVVENKELLAQLAQDFAVVFAGIMSVVAEAGKFIIKVLAPVLSYIGSVIRQLRVMTGAADAATAKAEMDAANVIIQRTGMGRDAYLSGQPRPRSFADKIEFDAAQERYKRAEERFKAAGGKAALPPETGTPPNLVFGGAGAGVSIDAAAPSGAKGAGSKPQTYISDLAKDLQRELELRVNAINQDASLSDREREIQEAGMRYNYEILINKAEYYAAVNDENKKDILNRKQYLADLDKALQDQNKLSQQRFEDVVTKPLRSALDEDRQAVIELEGSIASLAKGQSEQTNVEQRQSLIKKVTVGLTEEQSAALKPLFDLLLQTAAARDKLTEAEKRAQAIQEKIQARDSYIVSLQDEIKLLLIIGDEERRLAEIKAQYGDAKAQEIFNLEKIKKNIEETRALIDGFVSSTTSDYKGFLKAVISGEDAADALKQFQEGLKDKVLTIFLDFAMAPVEKFLKESLEGLFLPKIKKEAGELPKETTKDPVEATNSNTNATVANTAALDKVATALTGAAGQNQSADIASTVKSIGLSSGIDTSLNGLGGPAAAGFDAASVFGNPEALTSAFAGIQSSISTSMEGITSSFQMGADSLANTLPSWSDALATKLPAALTTSTNNTEGEIPKWQESLGKVTQGIGIAAGAIMGIAAGISQIKKGGTGNTLMGIGSIMASIGGGIGGFTKLFGANGGVAGGGWKPFPVSAFANGGMVKGPTLGLVGEGKYNEAIVPLPDGRSIPVQMRGAGGTGSRDLLANQAQSRPSPSVLSMSFQSTTINGVEYVDRAQLEAAMEETRRAASREGASKGASLAIDRLANSPSSRRRAGIR